MSYIHLCNCFFEQELQASQPRPLLDWFYRHPVPLQLQFLPLLYAGPNDPILVTNLPSVSDPRFCLLGAPPEKGTLVTWGASRAVAGWAAYSMPDWEVVKRVNSKVFSFSESPQLPGSALLSDEKELHAWIEKTAGPKVLKTPFGTAGAGHFHVGQKRGLPKQFPLIAEPWVERVLDFSTQWEIVDGEGRLLGSTIFHNEKNGTYLGTFVGKSFGSYAWALEEHLTVAKPLLAKMAQLGFFGNVGIDAYVYLWEGKERLQPIVEINGRKTMSWVAIQVQEKQYPRESIYFSYAKGKKGLLPSLLGEVSFERNVLITVT